MCPRFEQLRIDFTVARPSDLAAQRAEARDTHLSAAPDEWPPTVAEYRSILAERRRRSTSADQSRGRVIRTPGLRQIRGPPPPGSANAAGDKDWASPVPPRPSEQEPSWSPPKTAKGREGKDDGRRAARVRARSLAAAEKDGPPRAPSSLAAPTSADLAATDNSAAPPKGPETQSVVSVATESGVPTPRQPARPLMQAAPVRRVDSGSRAGVSRPWLVTVAVVAVGALIGTVVPILLSLP